MARAINSADQCHQPAVTLVHAATARALPPEILNERAMIFWYRRRIRKDSGWRDGSVAGAMSDWRKYGRCGDYDMDKIGYAGVECWQVRGR